MAKKNPRKETGFYFAGKEVSWEEIPLSIRKHDYPYYFDKDGNDCFPRVTDERFKIISQNKMI